MRRFLHWIGFMAPVLAVVLVAVYHVDEALWGADGYRELQKRQVEVAQLERRLADLQAQRQKLEDRNRRLETASLDPDLLDERVRAHAGFARSDELILIRIPSGEF